MDTYKLLITGGQPLKGDVEVSGGKNTSVAVIPAALICDEPCVIENMPDIEDVHVLRDILELLGARVSYDDALKRITIDPRGVNDCTVPYRQTRRMRASYYLLGALLARFGEANVGYPGGCAIGNRPFDQHIKGFRALGAEVTESNGMICAKGTMTGAAVYFDRPTVGGTINVMLAAVKAKGNTVLLNAAKEPHVVDLANFLNAMGGRIKGAGTDTIRIRGVESLHGGTYTVIPDQIETGTLMIAAAATRGDVTIHGCIPTHMESLTAKLLEMGVSVTDADDAIRVRPIGAHRAVNIKTQEYPGFPTDLQQPMSALLCMAQGNSLIYETIFESRFKHLSEMRRMGAHVQIMEQTALIEGVPELHGAPVTVTDLRAGAALVVAGLMATGTTEIYEPGLIERGYEHLEEKLRKLGAKIRREPV
ncbi:MAG: UDP-N-acetylglucosamine 1-carboxyvinyltransferase [Clostridia bacterium]|nr:UDP-N-acetylglucosamine 1-carboxyvinyltransferase [Clostridia bacterium]MBQ6233658.1 UDP-N-acetylglucosamine 1-carboxyvinyltransferase [Clostridia bacterium]